MLARTRPGHRVFRGGWGDIDHLTLYEEADALPEIDPIAPVIGPPTSHSDLITQDLRFESPQEHLPEAVRLARARIVTTPHVRKMVVLHASWNDHDFAIRERFAQMLARAGIGSTILEHPFYGERRPESGAELPLETVAGFGLMGRAAVLEGRAIAAWLKAGGHMVGVSGYSMGGNLAALVAATVPFAVAAAPLAGPHSPAPPFIDGVLRLTVDWDALGGDTADVRRRLSRYLYAASVLRFDPPVAPSAAVIVAGTIDGFVPTSSVAALHRHWPGSEMAWVNTGHIGLRTKHRRRMVDAIVRSFERLEAHEGEPGTEHGTRA